MPWRERSLSASARVAMHRETSLPVPPAAVGPIVARAYNVQTVMVRPGRTLRNFLEQQTVHLWPVA